VKKIEAYIRHEALEGIHDRLAAIGLPSMSVTEAKGSGRQKGYTETYRGADMEVNLLKKVRLEIAVNDTFVKPTVDAIIKGARTGKIGDGKIFIMDLPECIRIRTGETGGEAIG